MKWAALFETPTLRTNPFNAVSHPAIDVVPAGIPALGARIRALDSGRVMAYGRDADTLPDGSVNTQSRGIYLTVQHDEGTDRVTYCHLAGVPWPAEETYWRTVERGQHIAFCGYTGYTRPDNDPASAHIHLIMVLDGIRMDPSPFIDWGSAPPEDEMTPEQQRFHNIGVALMASVGNPDRPDLTVGWNMVEVTRGWALALAKSPLQPWDMRLRKNQKMEAQQLRDVASATEAVIRTGEGA